MSLTYYERDAAKPPALADLEYTRYQVQDLIESLLAPPVRTRLRRLVDENADHASSPNFGLLGEAVTPIECDYLCLGACVDPELYWDILAFFDLERIELNPRLYIERKAIWFDNKQVGHIVGSKGAPSAFGRKIQFHFKGEFFRNRTDKDQDILGDRLAFWLVRALELHISSLPVLSVDERAELHYQDWLRNERAMGRVDDRDGQERQLQLIRDDIAVKRERTWELIAQRNSQRAKADHDYYQKQIDELNDEIIALDERYSHMEAARLREMSRWLQFRVNEIVNDFRETFKCDPKYDSFWRKDVDKKLEQAKDVEDTSPYLAAKLRHDAHALLLSLTQSQLSKQGYRRPKTRDDGEVEIVKRHKRALEAVSKLKGKMWVNFVSIDRIDYAINCKVGEVKNPLELASCAAMLDGWFFSDCHLSVNGLSAYASNTKSPLANRGDYPHLCVYQTAQMAADGLMRLEFRVPKVRSITGNSGVDAAAHLAARHFSAVMARPVVAATDPQLDIADYDNSMLIVYPLQVEGVMAPDHIFSRAYRGHGKATVRRLGKQCTTITERVVGATIFTHDFGVLEGVPSEIDGGPDAEDYLDLGWGLTEELVERHEAALLAWRRCRTPDIAPLALRVRSSHVGSFPVSVEPQAPAPAVRSVDLEPPRPVSSERWRAVVAWDGGDVALPVLPELPASLRSSSYPCFDAPCAPPRKNTIDSYLLDYERTQELAVKGWVGRYKRPLPVALRATLTDGEGELGRLDYERQHEAAGLVPPIRCTADEVQLRFPSHYSRDLYLQEWARWESGERTRPPRWAVRAMPRDYQAA